MLKLIKSWSVQRWPWLLLAIIAVALEGAALYLQHRLQVEPCNECIYIRVSVLGIGVAGLMGAVAPRYLALRLAALAVWFTALAWGLYRADVLLKLERIVLDGGESSCARFKGFPAWMPLDTWLPEMFEPRAMCGMISWTFMGESVTFWIWVTLWSMALTATAVLLAQPVALAKQKP